MLSKFITVCLFELSVDADDYECQAYVSYEHLTPLVIFFLLFTWFIKCGRYGINRKVCQVHVICLLYCYVYCIVNVFVMY